MNDLRVRLYWIMGLRMALVTLMLGLSLAFQVAKGGWIETFYALIIVTYILTIPSVILLRVFTSPTALTILFWVQVVIDFLLETVLIARTGGIESPFLVLYVISVTLASLVPRRKVGLLTASLCVILFGVLTNLQLYGLTEAWGWLPRTRLSAPETFQTFGVHSLALLVVGFLRGLRPNSSSVRITRSARKSRASAGSRPFMKILSTVSAAVCLRRMRVGASRPSILPLRKPPGIVWRKCPRTSLARRVLTGTPIKISGSSRVRASHTKRFEVECTRANGNRLVLGMTLSPLQERGRTTGMVGVFKDLTQIRDLEEEMRRKEWLASLGEMSAGMAHEIRNPLGALAGAMQMLRKDLPCR